MMDANTKAAIKQVKKIDKIIFNTTEQEIQKGNIVFDKNGNMVRKDGKEEE
jgi:hypothetical protein